MRARELNRAMLIVLERTSEGQVREKGLVFFFFNAGNAFWVKEFFVMGGGGAGSGLA